MGKIIFFHEVPQKNVLLFYHIPVFSKICGSISVGPGQMQADSGKGLPTSGNLKFSKKEQMFSVLISLRLWRFCR
jgi:hypothetical protein